MIKILVSAWAAWFVYGLILEIVVPKAIYAPMENMGMALLIIIPIGGHVLTFFAIRINNRKIFDAAHNQQHLNFLRREKKAFRDMAFYTITTLLSLVPLMTTLNLKHSVTTDNVLHPWASTITMIVSSVNPVIQIQRKTTLREAVKATLKWNTV